MSHIIITCVLQLIFLYRMSVANETIEYLQQSSMEDEKEHDPPRMEPADAPLPLHPFTQPVLVLTLQYALRHLLIQHGDNIRGRGGAETILTLKMDVAVVVEEGHHTGEVTSFSCINHNMLFV